MIPFFENRYGSLSQVRSAGNDDATADAKAAAARADAAGPFLLVSELTLSRFTATSALLISFCGIVVSQFRQDTTVPFLLASTSLYIMARLMSQAEGGSGSAVVSGFGGFLSAIVCGVVMPLLAAFVFTVTINCQDSLPVLANIEAAGSAITAEVGRGGSSALPVMAAVVAPCLQGSTNGTIGPMGCDATYVKGLDRSSRLGAEPGCDKIFASILAMVGNAIEVLGLSWGVTVVIFSQLQPSDRLSESVSRVALGSASVFMGLSAPGAIQVLVQLLQEAHLIG